MIKRFNDSRDWFFDARFGMFIHWGLYAIDGWHEQMQWRKSIPRKEYGKLIERFNPADFDPDAWLDVAQEAGMKYLYFTTKHHDGFCLWNAQQTDFNVMNSPYGKDVLKMLADACHRRNFPLCLYYSVVDWHHPNYPNQNRSHELRGPEPGDEPDIDKYMEFLKAQVRQLCTDYGKIHGFFWDINRTGVRDTSINEIIRSLQPDAVINSRGFDEGDVLTTEREFDPFVNDLAVFEEFIEMTTSVGQQSWGYRKEEDYHTYGYLIRDMDKILAKGGNYVINVGPKPDGSFPKQAVDVLQNIGKWYHSVKEAFDGTASISNLTDNKSLLLTRKDNDLYVHINEPLKSTGVLIDPIDVLPARAVLLNTVDQLQCRVDILPMLHAKKKQFLRVLNLPANEFSNSVMVIKMKFDKFPELKTERKV